MGETHIKKKHHNIENALTSQFEVLESQIQNAVGCWDFSWGTGDLDSLKLTWQLKIFVNVLREAIPKKVTKLRTFSYLP